MSSLLFVPVIDCPARAIAFHVGAALAVGRSVELTLLEPTDPVTTAMLRAFELIHPNGLHLSSVGAGSWSSGARLADILIVTEKHAFFSERPWVRLQTDAVGQTDIAGFYSLVAPGSIVA